MIDNNIIDGSATIFNASNTNIINNTFIGKVLLRRVGENSIVSINNNIFYNAGDVCIDEDNSNAVFGLNVIFSEYDYIVKSNRDRYASDDVAGFVQSIGGPSVARFLVVDPGFSESPNAFTPTSTRVDEAGDDVGIAVDFYGTDRASRTPHDPGAVAFIATESEPSLSGTYSVPGDFASLGSALGTLTASGASGAVTFELVPGRHTDRVVVGPFPGVSATDPLTITAMAGESNPAVLNPLPAASSSDNFVVQFDGASHVRLNGLTLRTTDPDYQTGVLLSGTFEDIEVTDNLFEGSGGGTPTPDRVTVRTNGALTGDKLTIDGNTFTGVTTAVDLDGDPTDQPTKLRLLRNTVVAATGDGLAVSNASAPVVSNNDVEAERYAIRVTESSGASRVRRNRAVGGLGAIAIVASDATAGDRADLTNNFAVATDGGAALSVRLSDHWSVWHNSAAALGLASAALYLTGGEGLEVRNNALVSDGPGAAYDVGSPSLAAFESGTNAVWTTGATLGRVDGADYADLPSFLAALDGVDPDGTEGAGTVEADPAFADAAAGDLHSEAYALEGAGTEVGVGVDFDGDARPWPAGSDPDIGADETGATPSGPTSIVIDGPKGYRFLGPPSPGVLIDSLATQNLVRGVPGYYPNSDKPTLWTEYDASAGAWIISEGRGETLDLGLAFLWFMLDRELGNPDKSVSVELPFTLSTERPVNTEDVTVTLQTEGDKFNYLANPFGTDLDLTGIESWPGGHNVKVAFLEVYDPATRSWGPAPSVLAPWEGFRVKARWTASEPRTLTFPASAASASAVATARETSTVEFRATRDAAAGLIRLPFVLSGTDADGEPLEDRSFSLAFAEGASPAFASDEDGVRDWAALSPSYAAIGSRASGVMLGTDVRPFAPGEVVLAVGARGAARSFTLSWDATALPPGLPVALVDLATGAELDVRVASEYAFEAAARSALTEDEVLDGTAVEVSDRFVLRMGAVQAEAVTALAVESVAPNPSSTVARVSFAVPTACVARVSVVDVLGREVAVLVDGSVSAGRHEAVLDAGRLAAGVYVVRASVGGDVTTRVVTVTR